MDHKMMLASRQDLNTYLERVVRDKGYEVGRSFILPKDHPGSADHRDKVYRRIIATIKVTLKYFA